MRRTGWLGLGVVAALAATAVAFAAHQAVSTKSVTSTFTVTPSTQNRTSTCKGADGDYTRIKGSYAGAATSSETRLAGAIKIRGESLVNKTTGLGWMKGTLRIDTAGDEDTKASFTAVISGGQLNGLLNGRVHDPSGRLLGGLTTSFGSSGITGGSIGATSSTPAIVVTGGCGKGHDHDDD